MSLLSVVGKSSYVGRAVGRGRGRSGGRMAAEALEGRVLLSGATPSVESFNASLRDERLNVHWFESMEEAKVRIDDWRRDYNESRPHQALGQQTPFEYVMRTKDLDRSTGIETAGN